MTMNETKRIRRRDIERLENTGTALPLIGNLNEIDGGGIGADIDCNFEGTCICEITGAQVCCDANTVVICNFAVTQACTDTSTACVELATGCLVTTINDS